MSSRTSQRISRNLRQHVIPDPNPSSCGKNSHGMPV